MDTRRLEFGQYDSRAENGVSEFGRAISMARGRYDSLLRTLGQFGSEVSRSRTLESDPDIFPYSFVRHAKHLFVFPPQEVVMVESSDSGVIEGTQPYTLRGDIAKAEYDEAAPTGILEVSYDDAGNHADLEVMDLTIGDDSVVPPEVEAAIAEAVAALDLTTR